MHLTIFFKKKHPEHSPLSEVMKILWDDKFTFHDICIFVKTPTNHLFFSYQPTDQLTNKRQRLQGFGQMYRIQRFVVLSSQSQIFPQMKDDQKKVWREVMKIPKYSFVWNKYRKTWEFIRNYPILDVFFQMRFDNLGSYVFIHVQQQGP